MLALRSSGHGDAGRGSGRVRAAAALDVRREGADRRGVVRRGHFGLRGGSPARDRAGAALFTWRRQAREGRLGGGDQAPFFVPVVASSEPPPSVPALTSAAIPETAPASRPRRRKTGVIEIDLSGGRRLKVDRDVDAGALRRVLDALDGR